jgi:hypothetical protein
MALQARHHEEFSRDQQRLADYIGGLICQDIVDTFAAHPAKTSGVLTFGLDQLGDWERYRKTCIDRRSGKQLTHTTKDLLRGVYFERVWKSSRVATDLLRRWELQTKFAFHSTGAIAIHVDRLSGAWRWVSALW